MNFFRGTFRGTLRGTTSSDIERTPLRVVALWRPLLPKLDKRKKSTTCSGANLTTVSVCGGICRALPFIQLKPTQAK